MRTRSIFIIAGMLLIMTLSTAALVEGKKPITVVSYYIPLLVESEDSGAFVELLSEAAKRSGIEYTLQLYPTKRAMRLFEDDKVMAIIPALLTTLAKDAALTVQIFSKYIHGFVREGDAIPVTAADLEGKRVGLVRGFSYPRSITANEKIIIDYADTTDSSLKKLEDGRVDIVIADGHTAIHAIRRLGLQGLHYDLSVALHSQPAFIAFQPTEEGRELARRMSEALLSMKADGTYGAIVPDVE